MRSERSLPRTVSSRRGRLSIKASTAWAVPGLAALLALSSCGSDDGHFCTTRGGGNMFVVAVVPAVRATLSSLRVELCQAGRCRQVSFPATPPKEPGVLSREVSLYSDTSSTYAIRFDALGKGLKFDTKTRVVVLGFSPGKRVMVRHAEDFEFDRYYPNGKGCPEGPFLSYRTLVTTKDRVS